MARTILLDYMLVRLTKVLSKFDRQLDVRHLAATPMKIEIRVRAEVLEVVKNRVKLSIEAWDNQDKIGQGTHLRAVVEKKLFMARVLAKSE